MSAVLVKELVLSHHLMRQREFSEKAFGPMTPDNDRTAGVIDHIREETDEAEKNPRDISEWIDIALLAFDGALRNGFSPEEISQALDAKQTKNENREWPDWRTAPKGKAINHVRTDAEKAAAAPPAEGEPAPGFERVGVAVLADAFKVSVNRAKAAEEHTGYLYRELSMPAA